MSGSWRSGTEHPGPTARGHHPELSEELRQLGVGLGSEGLRYAAPHQRSAPASALEAVVPGRVVETPAGTCYLVETRYPLEHSHGGQPLSVLLPQERPSPHLARLAGDERLTGLDFRSSIFFDIETTGLGIGAGMYAFLVGLGTFEGDEFCLRQYFMRDYAEEGALLYLLAQQMSEFQGWVSFNGRNFDLPVLQARFVCGRRPMPLAEAPHLDLLYPARRLWRKRLTSCRLCSLEAGVLSLSRQSDVPGWRVPELYFDYLRYGYAEPLGLVFSHNAFDILSLVALAAKANAMLGEPAGQAVEHAVDLYSLATIYDGWGQWELAKEAYQRVLLERLPVTLHNEALHRLASLFKRSGEIERAVPLWQALCEQGQANACLELAKYYERHERDSAAAARWVNTMLALPDLPPMGNCSPLALTKRLARLKIKLGGGLPMPHIQSYSFGHITVDGQEYTSDLIILPGGVHPRWWRQEGHKLHPDDLLEVIAAAPRVLVIGTGNVGLMQVPQETLDDLAAHNIQTVMLRTALACERYNELAKTEPVAAALHLTC